MRPLSEIRHDAEDAHLTGSLGKTSYSLLFDVPALCGEVERLRSALRQIDTAANWVGRRNAWNRSLQHVGQSPNPDNACREIRMIVRSVLDGLSA